MPQESTRTVARFARPPTSKPRRMNAKQLVKAVGQPKCAIWTPIAWLVVLTTTIWRHINLMPESENFVVQEVGKALWIAPANLDRGFAPHYGEHTYDRFLEYSHLRRTIFLRPCKHCLRGGSGVDTILCGRCANRIEGAIWIWTFCGLYRLPVPGVGTIWPSLYGQPLQVRCNRARDRYVILPMLGWSHLTRVPAKEVES